MASYANPSGNELQEEGGAACRLGATEGHQLSPSTTRSLARLPLCLNLPQLLPVPVDGLVFGRAKEGKVVAMSSTIEGIPLARPTCSRTELTRLIPHISCSACTKPSALPSPKQNFLDACSESLDAFSGQKTGGRADEEGVVPPLNEHCRLGGLFRSMGGNGTAPRRPKQWSAVDKMTHVHKSGELIRKYRMSGTKQSTSFFGDHRVLVKVEWSPPYSGVVTVSDWGGEMVTETELQSAKNLPQEVFFDPTPANLVPTEANSESRQSAPKSLGKARPY
ncbi:hypothetical protein KFL_002180140 [Klebsormidium nitens]|uniref:Uncharacterized protein n=1 Tax=Klebsormidium nitens TaxID=105231 RepID=A0A1Y1I6I6_KLENI|nr:hypothetical protein KFL_002180140 [Klebsormidium nitens]|eukprot:GAQ85039.1 hypothetical protein KFL_002180140 [Klebsormidium nitens]